eukprot:jgi/Tetstr1/438430/TSEL_026987.t1
MGLLTATRERRVVHKVAVLGKAGAGKSALIATLQKRTVSEKYTETMGIQVVDVEGPVAYDGSGNELGTTTFRMWEVGSRYGTTFGYMNPEAVKDCAAAIVVFSFTDKASFQQVPSLLARCESNGIPCLLVGTKADDPAAGAVTARGRQGPYMDTPSANGAASGGGTGAGTARGDDAAAAAAATVAVVADDSKPPLRDPSNGKGERVLLRPPGCR